MGWTNYIIIPKLKLIVETGRNISESHDYQNEALDYLTAEERAFDEDEEREMSNISITDITMKDISLLYTMYEKSRLISEMEPDRLFLYWLESKGISYEILSEFDILDSGKMEQYIKSGYTILRMFDDKE